MALLVTDPVCFDRDENWDLIFPLRFARGLRAVAIGARTRLMLFAGEWFLNMLAGVKWLPSLDGVTIPEREAILGEQYDEAKATAEFRRELLTTPAVVSVSMLSLMFTPAKRNLAVIWSAKTLFGDTPVDVLRREF